MSSNLLKGSCKFLEIILFPYQNSKSHVYTSQSTHEVSSHSHLFVLIGVKENI